MKNRDNAGVFRPLVALIAVAAVGIPALGQQPDKPLVSLSPNGVRFAAVTGQQLQVFGVKNSANPLMTLESPGKRYTALSFNADSTILAASADKSVRRYSMLTGKKVGKDLTVPSTKMADSGGKKGPIEIVAIAFRRDTAHNDGDPKSTRNQELVLVDSGSQRLVRFARRDANSDYEFVDEKPTEAALQTLISDGQGGWVGTDATGNFHLYNRSLQAIGIVRPENAAPIYDLALSSDGAYLLAAGARGARIWLFGSASRFGGLTTTEPVAEHPGGQAVVAAALLRERDRTADQAIVIPQREGRPATWNFLETSSRAGTQVAANNGTGSGTTVAPEQPTTVTPTPEQPVPQPATPEQPKPVVPEPETPKPETPKPETPKPETPKPEVPEPEAPKPEVPKPAPETRPTEVAVSRGASKPLVPTFTRMRSLPGHLEYVNTVVFSPKGDIVASGGRDKTIQLWSVERGERLKLLRQHNDYVSSVAFNPEGSLLASGGWDKQIFIWKVDGAEKPVTTMNRHTSLVLSVAFSPDGKRLVSGSNDKTAILWNVADGKMIKQSASLPDAVATVAFSPDGKWIAGGCLDGKVYIWDAQTLARKMVLISNPSQPIFSVTFVDNTGVVAGGKDGFLRYWSLSKEGVGGAMLTTDGKDIFSVNYNPKKRLLAAGGADHLIRLYPVPTDLAPWAGYTKVASQGELQGHSDTVRAVDFDRTGNFLVSGGWDLNIVLWEVAAPGEKVATKP